MDEAPRLIRREALPPRSRNGIFAPVAAAAIVTCLSVLSLAVAVAPHARRRQVHDHTYPAPPRPAATRVAPVPPPPLPASSAAPPGICRGPVYRAGPDGVAEMVYEVCADAQPPRVIVAD